MTRRIVSTRTLAGPRFVTEADFFEMDRDDARVNFEAAQTREEAEAEANYEWRQQYLATQGWVTR